MSINVHFGPVERHSFCLFVNARTELEWNSQGDARQSDRKKYSDNGRTVIMEKS